MKGRRQFEKIAPLLNKKNKQGLFRLACVLDTLVFSTIFQGLVDFLGFDHRIDGNKKPNQEVNQNKV